MHAEVAHGLLPKVKDEAWFFDTELLVLAQREGLRIHEVPVDWIDDPGSRVVLLPTVIEDLRGVWRLSSELRTFAAIGVLSTLAYTGGYALLRFAMPAWLANAASLLLTNLGNTTANRRFTFKGDGNRAPLRAYLSGFAALGAALGLTSVSLRSMALVAPHASRPVEITVLTLANLVATGVRFVLLRMSIAAGRQDTAAMRPRVLETTS